MILNVFPFGMFKLDKQSGSYSQLLVCVSHRLEVSLSHVSLVSLKYSTCLDCSSFITVSPSACRASAAPLWAQKLHEISCDI